MFTNVWSVRSDVVGAMINDQQTCMYLEVWSIAHDVVGARDNLPTSTCFELVHQNMASKLAECSDSTMAVLFVVNCTFNLYWVS